jgi:hypothetical protein
MLKIELGVRGRREAVASALPRRLSQEYDWLDGVFLALGSLFEIREFWLAGKWQRPPLGWSRKEALKNQLEFWN